MVALARRTKGEESELYKQAAGELAQYEKEQEDKKTPSQRVHELQRRLGHLRDDVARASERLTQAETDLEQATANLQNAEETLGDSVRKVEQAEAELQEAEALLPAPLSMGTQVQKPSDLEKIAVLIDEIGAHTLTSDTAFQQLMREAATSVGRASQMANDHQANVQAAQIEQAKEDSKAAEAYDSILPEGGPWQISTGTKARACLFLASKATQRHVLNFHARGKGQGKKGKGGLQSTGMQEDPLPAQAKDIVQGAAGGAASSGTTARTPASARGTIGGEPADEKQDADMEPHHAGFRRKREPEERGGVQDVERDPSGQKFRWGDAGDDDPDIPPRNATT